MPKTIEQTLVINQLEQLCHDTEVTIKFLRDMGEADLVFIPTAVMESLIEASYHIDEARQEFLK